MSHSACHVFPPSQDPKISLLSSFLWSQQILKVMEEWVEGFASVFFLPQNVFIADFPHALRCTNILKVRFFFHFLLNLPVFPRLWSKTFQGNPESFQSCECSAQSDGTGAFQMPKRFVFLVVVLWGAWRRATSTLRVDVHTRGCAVRVMAWLA